jgi:hypothetical protein
MAWTSVGAGCSAGPRRGYQRSTAGTWTSPVVTQPSWPNCAGAFPRRAWWGSTSTLWDHCAGRTFTSVWDRGQAVDGVITYPRWPVDGRSIDMQRDLTRGAIARQSERNPRRAKICDKLWLYLTSGKYSASAQPVTWRHWEPATWPPGSCPGWTLAN